MKRSALKASPDKVREFTARGRASSVRSLKHGPVSPASPDDRRTAGPRVCAQCGVTFDAWAGRRTSRYCSRECGWAHQKAEATRRYPPKAEVEALYAALRSIQAMAHHYGHSADWGKRVLTHYKIAEYRREPLIVVCAECGKELRRSPSHLAKVNQSYCSIACRSAKDRRRPESVAALADQLSRDRVGKLNPAYKHGREPNGVSSRAWNLKAKGEETCRRCGGAAMYLHHIVPRSFAPQARRDVKRNGMPLCGLCHVGWHLDKVTIAHDLLSDDEFLAVLEYANVVWLERRYPDRPSVFAGEQIEDRIQRLTGERT